MDKNTVEVLCEHTISGRCENRDCPAAKRNSVGRNNCARIKKGVLAYKYNCSKIGDVLLLADRMDDPNYLFSVKKKFAER